MRFARSLLLSCAVLVPCQVYSYTKAELDKKYAFNESFDWQKFLKTTLNESVLNFLNKGLFQEAIWLLEEAEDEITADKLKNFLYYVMKQSHINKYAMLPLKGGVTDTKLVYLKHGIKAVLKLKSSHPSSNYRSEIAAYRIDQLGKFALVPMTVERRFNGQLASLQYFVEGAISAGKVPNYKKSARLNLFDYMIHNRDRSGDNVLIANNREVAIDHGLSLSHSFVGETLRAIDKSKLALGLPGDPVRLSIVFPKKNLEKFHAEERIMQALKNLTRAKMTQELYPLLGKKTIFLVWKKREKVLNSIYEIPKY